MLELMARGSLRIGEVLKFRLKNLQDRKLIPQKHDSEARNIIRSLYDVGRR